MVDTGHHLKSSLEKGFPEDLWGPQIGFKQILSNLLYFVVFLCNNLITVCRYLCETQEP